MGNSKVLTTFRGNKNLILRVYLIDIQLNKPIKSCRCRYFFVSLSVKKRRKTSATPTGHKDTKEFGTGSFFRQLKSSIVKKCSSFGIRLTDMSESSDGFVFYGHTTLHTSRCPHCGKSSRSVHDYRYRKLQCTEFLSRPVQLMLRIRHFRCLNPECTCRTFSESLKLANPYSRMTHEVESRVLYESLNQSARLASESLSRQHIRICKTSCTLKAKSLGLVNPKDIRTSGYVAIDDLAYRKGRRYMCAITDHYTRRPLALFDSRYGFEITEWLRSHPEIRLVSRDGSMSYEAIIKEALPEASQVSDRFHLMKNLRETMVEGIRKHLGKPGIRQPYPYPSEEEAYRYISDAIFSMGEAPHRTKVSNYFMVRKMQDEGMTLQQVSESIGMSSAKVRRLQQTSMNKLLNKDQKACIRHARELARIISCGCITPKSLAKRMEGKLKSSLVCRCIRELAKKYKELRQKVRECNHEGKAKGIRIGKSAIWNYIITGKTDSKKLLEIHKTYPKVQQDIGLCIGFVRTLFNRDGAMKLDEWIDLAEKAQSKEMKSFAQYIKSDKKAIEMACLTNYSNGMMEGTVNKIKEIKRTMFNRAGIELLRAKVIYANYGKVHI